MSENKNYSKNKKKNNSGYYRNQFKKITYENNSINGQSVNTPVNEFSSIGSQQAYSNYYFGLNIFDL